MDLLGDTDSDDERKVMNQCVFDIKISDSQFELKDEVAGPCDQDEAAEEKETEDAENSSNPQRSDSKSLSETGKSIASGSSGKGRLSPNPAAPGSGSGTGTISNDNAEDQVYHGLPPPGSQKHYRTDYPRELRLKKVCSPKPHGKRKTVDNYHTQPLAAFSPIGSIEYLPRQGSNESGTTTGSQNQQASSDKVVTAYTKGCQPRARELPPIVSVSDEDVIDYLEDYNIQMMFEYFLSMCVLNIPEDPFKYIADMAAQLIQARSDDGAFEKLPRLLSPAHVESMFRLYDRVGAGYIGYSQYRNAFEAMGLVRFNQEPHGYLTNEITNPTFVNEANKSINELLRSFMKKTVRSGDDC